MLAGLVAGVVLALSAPAAAQTTTPLPAPVVVEPGPARTRDVSLPCTDVVLLQFQERLSFVLRRSGSTAAPLAAVYRLSGGRPGVHYDQLPGWVVFPAGVGSVVVPVTPRATPNGAIVRLTMEAWPGGSTAAISFVSPPGPGPHECGYRFTPDRWNTWQVVPVGGTPHPLTVERFLAPVFLPAAGRFRIVSGGLPAGVTLAPDGTFTGRATTPGYTAARIEACRPEPPGTCVTTDLVIAVTPAAG